MPLVLAIEPDRRQAAHLAAIVRHQVGAELLIADTTEGALDAIGNRIPDLVLVPALLSPQDDAALAAALRVIAAAAHVRTLTIPVLASGITHAPKLGILAKWRKGRDASPEPDGCDPAVFAEQISAYLQEAAAARAQLDDDLLLVDHPAIVVEPPPVIESEWADPIAAVHAEPVQPWAAAVVEETVERVEPVTGHADADIDLDDPSIDLSEELESLSDDEDVAVDGELFDGERVGVYTISADPGEVELEAGDRLLAIVEQPAIAGPVVDTAAAGYDEVALPEFAAWSGIAAPSPTAGVEPEPLFVEPPEPPRAHATSWVPMYLTPGRMWPALEGMPAEMPVARTEQPDWIELVASLRQDLERRRTDQAPAAADPIAARPSDGGVAEPRLVAKKQKSPKKSRPVQDEWGFFDPEQCGFSTLLAKLDEITEDASGL
ncbi:MAG: hypothetical protein JWL71_1993 [Acidobacteria bacterium]|nr:hypothetical protein [Acidobacteriota bacterium]